MSEIINWVCVHKTNSRFEADALKVNLEHADIPCVIINKQDSSYLMFGYVEVHIPESYRQAAEHIINESNNEATQ